MIDDKMQNQIILQVMQRVRDLFAKDGSGHGIDHVMRVYNLSVRIAREESCDVFVAGLAALLHDVGDYKLSADGQSNHCREISTLLEGSGLPVEIVDQVVEIVGNVSFKGNGVADAPVSIEGRCVRDADRLDAIGSIGIARAFAYGALKGRSMYDSEVKPATFNSFADYQKNNSHTINHFYEKLLLLKDRMETAAGKRLAEGRHVMLTAFLDEFLLEWNGEK